MQLAHPVRNFGSCRRTSPMENPKASHLCRSCNLEKFRQKRWIALGKMPGLKDFYDSFTWAISTLKCGFLTFQVSQFFGQLLRITRVVLLFLDSGRLNPELRSFSWDSGKLRVCYNATKHNSATHGHKETYVTLLHVQVDPLLDPSEIKQTSSIACGIPRRCWGLDLISTE